MNKGRPKISVFSACKNGGRFLRETLDSILNQTFEDFEIVLVDGASTDDTLRILEEEYKSESRLRWISEVDNDANEGFHKAIAMTCGEYVMCCPVSDGYLSRNWFQKCVDILDNDIEVSLVYGTTQIMYEDGSFGNVNFQEWFKKPPPNKMNFLPYWLMTFSFITELTYCVRSEVYKKCFPAHSNLKLNYENPPEELTDELFDAHGPFKKFLYNFNVSGYLPYYLPFAASFGRYHTTSRNELFKRYLKIQAKKYTGDIIKYRKDLLNGRVTHSFMDGNSNIIKTLSKEDLKLLSKKILLSRINIKAMCGYKDKIHRKFFKGILKIGFLMRLLCRKFSKRIRSLVL